MPIGHVGEGHGCWLLSPPLVSSHHGLESHCGSSPCHIRYPRVFILGLFLVAASLFIFAFPKQAKLVALHWGPVALAKPTLAGTRSTHPPVVTRKSPNGMRPYARHDTLGSRVQSFQDEYILPSSAGGESGSIGCFVLPSLSCVHSEFSCVSQHPMGATHHGRRAW